MSKDSSKKQSKTETEITEATINDNLLLDNIHVRLVSVETKVNKVEEDIEGINKKVKNKWLSLIETIIIASALIVASVLTYLAG